MVRSFYFWQYLALACTGGAVIPAGVGEVWAAPAVALDERFPQELARIRVRVFPHRRNFPPHFRERNVSQFRISSSQDCMVYAADDLGERTERLVIKARVLVLQADRLRGKVWIVCASPFTLHRLGDVPSHSYAAPLLVSRKVQNGRFTLQAVLHLDIETYLKGVVPSEVMAGWPEETLKSQAVAARTYAIFHMLYAHRNRGRSEFDVDDSVMYQAYTGIGEEHDRTNRAVETTAGEILMFGKEVIQAYYHADSGGMTASAASVFNLRLPYCRHKKEPYSMKHAPKEWRTVLTLNEFNQKLRQMGHLTPDNPAAHISIPTNMRTASGRVTGLRLVLQDGSILNLGIAKLKRAIALDSSKFKISGRKGRGGMVYTFTGRGFGHGVGMNQRGAMILAEHYDWTYKKILHFYYHGARLCSLKAKANEKLACLKYQES